MMAVSAPQMARPASRVIGNAGGHQQAADIGVAQAERAEFVGTLGDLARRELRHHHRDFQHDGPQPHGVLVALDLEFAGLLVAEGQQIQRGEIAGGVVEEHVFRARIAGADFAGRRAGVPVVDRGVVLQARIGRSPGGVADLLPQRRAHRASWRSCRSCGRSGPTCRRLRPP